MARIVIELKENRELNIYTDQEGVEVVVIDWREVKEDTEDLPSWNSAAVVENAERELLHKTTGLKQVYP